MDSYSVEAVLSARDEGLKSGLEQAGKSAQNLEKKTASIGSSIRKSFAFGALVRAGGKAFDFVTNSAKGLVSELSQSQATWKTFEGNMKILKKTKGETQKVRKSLQDFATKTIYSASDMATTYSQLEAVGIKGTTNLVKGFGGLAAAAENPQQAMKTLSQQATQMAAKPQVQWMDFKLMLEQTPAGIAAIAKTMGKTTSELVKDVQDGKVKTNDFFNAIKKTAGEGTKFYEMATKYKTVGQAVDGLKETLTTKLQPAFDKVSEYGIKGISKITSVIDKIDGEKIAKSLGGAIDKAVPVIEKVFKAIAPVAASAGKTLVDFGKAAFDVGRAITSNKAFMDGLTNAFNALGAGIQKANGFISKHQDTIGKLAPVVIGAVLAFTKFRKITALLGKVPLLAGGGGGGIAAMFATINPTAVLSFAGAVAVLVGALIALSAARSLVIPFLEGLAGVVGKLGTAILPLVQGTIQALAQGIVTIAPAAQTLASAFASLSPLVSAFGVAISQVVIAVGQAVATILPALAPVITAIGQAIATVLPALVPVISAVGTAISQIVMGIGQAIATILPALAPVVEAVGNAVSQIITAVTPLVSVIGNVITRVIAILAPYIPNIQKIVEITGQAISDICSTFTYLVGHLSGIINSITNLVTVLGTQIVNIFTQIQTTITTFGNTVSQILITFGTTVSTVLTSVGNLFTTFGTTVQTVFDSVSNLVSTVGEGIRTVLDGIAGIFQSMGNAALNAGTGVQRLADGIIKLTGTNLADLAATLAATAAGLGKMAGSSSGLASVASSISKIGSSGNAAKNGLMGMASAAKSAIAALVAMNGSLSSFAGKTASAGQQAGARFSSGLSNGLKQATSKTQSSIKTIVSTLTRGASQAINAGKHMGTGASNGIKSGLAKAPGYASQATNQVGSRVRAGYGSAYSAGYHIGSGVAAGLRASAGAVEAAAARIVAAANKAARAKAKIHSPSKLTKKKVGKPLAQGIAVGMKEETKKTGKAASNVVLSSVKYMSSSLKSAKSYTKTIGKGLIKNTTANGGGYSKAGKTLSDAFKKNLTNSQKSGLKSGKTLIQKYTDKYFKTYNDKVTKSQNKLAKNKSTIASLNLANKTATKAQKKANEKRIIALKKQNIKLNNKIKKNQKKHDKRQKKSDKMSSIVYAQYEKYYKAETEKLISAAESSISKVTDKYQELYDAVIEKRKNFFGKLSAITELYTQDDYGYTKFADFKAMTAEVNAYSKNVEKLKKLLPDGLMEEILGMDRGKGLAYTNQLLKMSSAQLKQYGKEYTDFITASTKASNLYYQPQLDKIKKDFDSAVDTEMKALNKKMQTLGQDAVSGFLKGVASKNKKLAAVAKSLGNSLTTVLKKSLKIHSPSKVMEELGNYTGQGFINGISETQAEANRAMFRLVEIPQISTPDVRTAYSDNGFNENYSYSNTRIETVVVVDLDGREVARTIVDPMSEELNRKERRSNRKKGIA